MMNHINKIALGLIVVMVAYLCYKEIAGESNKVAVIQMEELVYEYQGMKDATKEYQKKLDKWNTQADSLEQILTTLFQEIKMDSINGDIEKLKRDQQRFHYLKKSYYTYQQKVSEKAQQDDQDMTVGVLNQLQEHIKNYAIENHYSMIVANTQMDNVSYVDQELDITEELLAYANESYYGN